ncbi:FtsQ-type POTRA domain-containing protein [Microbulbifer sp. OS29]|uniref:Cell division protein FtsQ n=1 Tax=Microbulbifer okhotskensis TaxID=2926617 RepID=A0A9X2EK27_9GAMM|nr:FtsQ-type POTRA domain-containing protein [Microbulbifer okhotskensis]MCO1333682.1 FtsQ-type POTRA domain-containing protein [Microbulbifer okhotskensis]
MLARSRKNWLIGAWASGVVGTEYAVKGAGAKSSKKKGKAIRGASPLGSTTHDKLRLNWGRCFFLLAICAGFFVVLYGGSWLWKWALSVELSQVDALEQVKVRGAFNAVTEEELREALLPYLKAGFFSADIQAMQRTLLANPWITAAAVNRRWPKGVEVDISEAQPLAVWEQDKLLVASGKLLPRPAHMKVQALPELAGDEELVERIMSQYRALAGLLTTRDMEVKRLSFDDLGGWHLELMSGVELKLGHDALLERVHRFLFLSRGVLAPHLQKVASVDARYSNAIAVQWKDEKE